MEKHVSCNTNHKKATTTPASDKSYFKTERNVIKIEGSHDWEDIGALDVDAPDSTAPTHREQNLAKLMQANLQS